MINEQIVFIYRFTKQYIFSCEVADYHAPTPPIATPFRPTISGKRQEGVQGIHLPHRTENIVVMKKYQFCLKKSLVARYLCNNSYWTLHNLVW